MVSDSFPPAAGEFAAGSTLAGYRLDEIIGRGGMAVVHRAFDGRLQRRVALKVLAPELVRDEEFRLRFIRESRAAAAVDHPNILPIFEAGEADGVLFIAMRYVHGGDVRALIDEAGALPVPRACAIVAQVASALDLAHAHGLVHRDVKPANMLRDATSYAGQPDHVYLSDFGLSKRSVGSGDLTSRGHFLGTLNYVAPEQIEGRSVDGRADLYALACSAFEMLSGQPPFKRDDNMAIMWAQVNAAPPPLAGRNPRLPKAVNDVMNRALAKRAGDRYVTCLEFATALASACGLRPAEPQLARALAGIGLGAPAQRDRAKAEGQAAPPAPPPLDRPVSEKISSPASRRPWVARRSGATVVAACVAVLGVTGGYLLLGKPGHSHASASNHGTPGSAGASPGQGKKVIAPPACTTQAAEARTLKNVPSHPVGVGKMPFDVVMAGRRFGFVSDGTGITVLNTARAVPSVLRSIPLKNAQGEVLTHDGRYLLVAAGSGMTVFKTSALERGQVTPLGSLVVPGGKHAVEVAVSRDDKFAFVSLQQSQQVAVFNLRRALGVSFGPADVTGTIPLPKNPVGITVSRDGQFLYVASGLARPATTSGTGTLSVVSVATAESKPATSVRKSIDAGCGPDRLAISPDGRYLWLTSGGGNALLAYSTASLLTDTQHALVAKVALGELPLGMIFVHYGTAIVVADSNRDQLASAAARLAVVGVKKALAGQPGALLGLIKSGVTPRQFALEPNGTTLLVTNTESDQVQAVNITHLP